MKNLPTLRQIEEIRHRLHARVFGYGQIARLTGVRPSVVKRIAKAVPTLTNLPLLGSPKAVAERLRCLTGNA